MSIPFSKAPHIEGAGSPRHPTQAPNAALLVDFDNVTMGMRSDLSKELKGLLDSDIIKGKVTVQRAYADWRRYPQYIVPLSEASIDLIFAPAYGSSKKNATDIRMAIDGIELVFTRPEIGTYILLTGDSDFSSLVLKLKEYGKYVIGVGIQESSSDILVQNCDEYYSYTSLSGLRKSDDSGASSWDPWLLVEKAVEQMEKRNDVMRSDRLKQVMLELDSRFDEKGMGFSKFSRFLSEASGKGLLRIRKMENGQYEILSSRSSKGEQKEERREPAKSDRGRASPPRTTRPDRTRAPEASGRSAEVGTSPGTSGGPAKTTSEPEKLGAAYRLLRRAIDDLLEDQDSDSVRDSDVKRRMLALERGFDEAELGFSKFSRFLRQAHDHEIVDLRKGDGGNYQVALGARESLRDEGAKVGAAKSEAATPKPDKPEAEKPLPRTTQPKPEPEAPAPKREVPSKSPSKTGAGDLVPGRLHPRRAGGRRGSGTEPPPLFKGQVVASRSSGASKPAPSDDGPAPVQPPEAKSPAKEGAIDPEKLQLPRGRESVVQYLSNSYRGVGQKTAEALVDAFGDDLFTVLQQDPAKAKEVLTPSRYEKFMEAWVSDFERRRKRHLESEESGRDSAPDSDTRVEASSGVEASTGGAAGERPRRSRRTRS